MRNLFPPRLWTTVALVATFVAAFAITPVAQANYAGETCIDVSYINVGTRLDVAVQRGHSMVVMAMVNKPDAGATVVVTVSPNICAADASLTSLTSSARSAQPDGADVFALLP